MAGDDVARKAARQRIFALAEQHSIYSNSFRPVRAALSVVELVPWHQLNHPNGSVSTPSENEKKKEKEGEKVSNLLPPLILSAAPPGARRGMKLIIILF